MIFVKFKQYFVGLIFLSLLFFNIGNAQFRLPPAPTIKSDSYILVDFNSGKILLEKNINIPLEPASITKVMTAYVVLKELSYGDIDDKVRISRKAYKAQGSRTFLEYKDEVPIQQVLQGLIVQSGNDAAIALAEHIDGDEDSFATRMNQYANRLGMNSTNFVNSSGLPDPEHYSTAEDMIKMSIALIKEFPNYYKMFAEKSMTYNKIKQLNRNRLLWNDPTVDGIKTGHTKSAGYSLLASAKRGDMRLISAILKTNSDRERTLQSQKLLNYGFRYFNTKKILSAGEIAIATRIWQGTEKELPLTVSEDWYVTAPKSAIDKLSFDYIVTNRSIKAPIEKGVLLGKAVASFEKEVVAEAPLVSQKTVQEGGFFDRMIDLVLYFFNWLWLKIIG